MSRYYDDEYYESYDRFRPFHMDTWRYGVPNQLMFMAAGLATLGCFALYKGAKIDRDPSRAAPHALPAQSHEVYCDKKTLIIKLQGQALIIKNNSVCP